MEIAMAEDIKCPKCQAAMKEGYLQDRTTHLEEGHCVQQKWVPGRPQRPSFWTGSVVSADQRAKALPIITHRCPTCGFLESYAPPQKNP
jgi:uncharacterized C2H2 Zn-finger protein